MNVLIEYHMLHPSAYNKKVLLMICNESTDIT